MNKSENHWLGSVSRYGAALAGLSLCGHATAGTVSLGTNFATIGFSNTSLVSLGIASVLQFNDSVGKTVFARYSSSNWGVDQFKTMSRSNTLTANFFGSTYGYGFGPAQTGTQFFGFLTKSGQLGWFQLSFGGQGGDVVYLSGAYSDTPGESIHVGSRPNGVPEPSSLALVGLGALAAGASGVRRLRKQNQARQAA